MSGSATTEVKVEELKQDSEIQRALDQTAGPKEAVTVPAGSRQRLFLGSYFLLLLLLARVDYLLRFQQLPTGEPALNFLYRR